MKSDPDDLISSFVNRQLNDQLKAIIATNKSSVLIDFADIDNFSPELGDYIIRSPVEAIADIKHFISELGAVYKELNLEVRIRNLPTTSEIKIRDIRSRHIGKILQVGGLIKVAVSVRPMVTAIEFECQSCGHVIKVEQKEKTIKMPSICTNCGKKGRFNTFKKELIDSQKIILEEAPEDLEGGAQPEHIDVMLKGDLVDPKFEKNIIPGNKVVVTGIVNEAPVIFPSGKKSRTSEISIEASYLEAVEQGFEEIIITKEEEATIREMAQDKTIYNKFRDSITPNVFGHDAIKDAVVLQLFGGVRKVGADGNSVIRGDIHLLLCGDPGCLIGDERIVLGNGAIIKLENLGERHLQPLSQQILTGQGYTRDTATTFHYYPNQPVMEIVTESGKSIVGTYNHPLLIKKIADRENIIDGKNPKTGETVRLSKKVTRTWKRLDRMKVGDEVQVISWIPCTITSLKPTGFKLNPRKFGPKFKGSLPSLVTEDVAALFGYILGDGRVNSDKHKCGLIVSNKEIELLELLVSLVKKTFSLSPKVSSRTPSPSIYKNRIINRTEKMYTILIDSEDIAKNLAFLAEKRVPDSVLASGNKVAAQFLKWLFTADGYVVNYQNPGRESLGFVSFKSAYIELVRDLQILLLRFGIASRIIHYKNENGYNLFIRSADGIEKYYKYIGFAIKKKQDDLKKIARVAASIEKRHHRHRFEKIVSIRPLGVKDVYDIEVPKGHRFIANGIISHNTAKSATLKYVSGIAPKARYVTGMGSSAAGLTATIIKDEATRSYILEAGALPLTNKGILAIDEIDKMNKDDRVAMHEALEQQTISISKANIHATLSAQTSVLAAANPKLGRFNPFDVISSQIELPSTLINRFDLIFIMKDKPNKDTDKLIASRILEANKDINKNKPAIPTPLLKKYIAYAKQNCRPMLSNDAMNAIQEFYLKLRSQYSTEGEEVKPVPISARQLEAIVRLSEASAKVRLSEYATIEDARRAIDLMMAYLGEVGIDKNTGELDIDRVITGISSSQRSTVLTIKSIIRSETEQLPKGSALSMTKIYEDASKSGMNIDVVDQAISVLKREGDIFEPKSGFIKLIT